MTAGQRDRSPPSGLRRVPAVDAKDGIYFTDPLFLNKDKREQDKEAVYYITPEGKILRVADDLEKPNGIALAGDGKTLFVADTAKSKLRAYPVNKDGSLGEGRTPYQ